MPNRFVSTIVKHPVCVRLRAGAATKCRLSLRLWIKAEQVLQTCTTILKSGQHIMWLLWIHRTSILRSFKAAGVHIIIIHYCNKDKIQCSLITNNQARWNETVSNAWTVVKFIDEKVCSHIRNIRTVARKSSIRGLYVCAGVAWCSNLTKIPLIYNVSFFNLGELGALFGEAKPTKAPSWRWDWVTWVINVYRNAR